jgi:ferrous iron transport protein A
VARLCADRRHGLAKGRLADLGFVPGTRLRIIRLAPLRDPIEIEIRDTRVCARREELAALFAVPEDGK